MRSNLSNTDKECIEAVFERFVPVVRCEDCEHMEVSPIGFRWCNAWERIQTMGDDGFCNFGERKDRTKEGGTDS